MPPSFCSQACKVKTSQATSTTSKLFLAHPPLPGLPAGMKAVHLGGGLAGYCVCASLLGVIKPAAWRFVCGDGQPRVGRDGLGVAGSGADGVGGTAGRLRPAGVPQRLMSRSPSTPSPLSLSTLPPRSGQPHDTKDARFMFHIPSGYVSIYFQSPTSPIPHCPVAVYEDYQSRLADFMVL